MSQVFLSPYKLHTQPEGRLREGFLLKLKTSEFTAGYADIFPWPEFGDPSFKDIPALIKNKQWTPLLEKSFHFAKKDGKARQEKKSLLEGKILKNHYLVIDLQNFSLKLLQKLVEKGFKRIKVKVGKDSSLELRKIEEISKHRPSDFLLRLDCNTQASLPFISDLCQFKEAIEYIEDPFSNSELWNNNPLFAYDHPGFAYEKVKTKWQIIKPAKQSYIKNFNTRPVFTSYMDHPVGLAHAFCEAFETMEQKDDYGFLSHNCYQPTNFHDYFKTEGPCLSFVAESGIGFTDLLNAMNWVPIC